MKNFFILVALLVSYNMYGQKLVNLTDYNIHIQNDTCFCTHLPAPLEPEKCGPIQKYYTEAVETKKYFVRCELLTKLPLSRPEGFSAYKLSPEEKYSGYWEVGYGFFDTIEEATEMAVAIRVEYPEFCKAFAKEVPKYSNRYKYMKTETTTYR